MVNKDRVVDEFIQLIKIDSISLDEREMADKLRIKLLKEGFNVKEDDAANKIGGNSGNLICNIKGNKNVPPILLMAHMDTVSPGIDKKPKIEGDFIKSDGTTVLGGDDVAGIVCILETVRVLKEQNIAHGDIYIVFTVAEELGLLGAKNLDFSLIDAKYGFIMDLGGEIGYAAVAAPTQNTFDIKITGKASHAGIEPEKGISAIQIAADAISKMKLGRIDDETTANIGTIKGGEATNIVCENIEVRAEARSRKDEKLKEQTEHMKRCFKDSADRFGGKVVFKTEHLYPAFNINENEDIVSILKAASKKTGIELKLGKTGGGSDTNIINSKGIKAVDLSVGMDKIHSVKEQINIHDMVKASEFLIAIIQSVY
ncbi:M20/M25/M40 family metallo-hydrolase [Herbivorax sp. ANBcel31]|uniref:M20/M25/M40 family metallo-hydrolase n=1 Tax=Herbivorax sp. ANBcel31 TaxID=3069754 RepID=UPI0027B7637B|nr:M20/M25/M40 family metallo-hydrolase [Herbivorax sp. ANBcel31]MDQ2086127.1 M20/M25/M40 family metallo-hydrolase [Herbivorax sp. ANBcel31]